MIKVHNVGEIKSSERLYFCDDIAFKACDEGWLVISVTTANWIVLNSDFQRVVLEHLITGETIGEVLSLVDDDLKMQQFKSLLSRIFAREFASTQKTPEPVYLEGYKMLNCYLTNACNLRCQHCFMRSGNALERELSTEEWESVLNDFRTSGGVNVTFTGGEPLMRKDFPLLLEYAHNIGLEVTVLSNGVLWTDALISELSPFISEVQISIDGFDENSNSKVRGIGNFDKIVRTVVLFANKGVKTSVATTFTLDNLQSDSAIHYKSFVNDIKSRCDGQISFKLSKKILPGRNTSYSEKQNKEFHNKILKIENDVDPHSKYNYFMEGHTPNLVARNCGFGGLSINADGSAYYCNRIHEVENFGNVRDMSLLDLMQQGRRLHMETSVDNLVPCKDCHLRYICSGGCRIDDCNFNGKIKHFTGDLCQVKCDDAYKERLERKMIDSFCFYYMF